MAEPLDPRIRRVLDVLALTPRPEAAGGGSIADLVQHRAAFRSLMRMSPPAPETVTATAATCPGPVAALPLRLYAPPDTAGRAEGALPGLVFLHGGGFVCGDLDTHDALCRVLCEAGCCRIVAVDYRLAPEHPYPAALQDAAAATEWAIAEAASLRLDPARIAIGGDSAGATLAAAVARDVSSRRPGALALQFLLCPILDWTIETPSRRDFSTGYLLDSATMAAELACTLPPDVPARDPRISPLRAADLRGLPPAQIHVAAFDPLRDEGYAYAARLREAGVAVDLICHAGMVHLFWALGRAVPRAAAALREIGAALGAALAAG